MRAFNGPFPNVYAEDLSKGCGKIAKFKLTSSMMSDTERSSPSKTTQGSRASSSLSSLTGSRDMMPFRTHVNIVSPLLCSTAVTSKALSTRMESRGRSSREGVGIAWCRGKEISTRFELDNSDASAMLRCPGSVRPFPRPAIMIFDQKIPSIIRNSIHILLPTHPQVSLGTEKDPIQEFGGLDWPMYRNRALARKSDKTLRCGTSSCYC